MAKEKAKDVELKQVIESLSPNERLVVPHLGKKNIDDIAEITELNKAAVLRSLEFLSNKDILNLKITEEKIIELGVNGLLYKKKGLPERRLLHSIIEKKSLKMQEAKKASELSDNEFKAALGVLKKKALVNLVNGRLMLAGKKAGTSKKTLEEQLIDELPLAEDKLKAEQKFAVESLKNRKDIINVVKKSKVNFSLTDLGKKIVTADLSIGFDLIEVLSSDILKSGSWRGKKFRRYDIKSPVPKISGGKRHFLNQGIDYGRKVWTDMGFKEMSGNLIQTGFWNFDALFTAQDHPVRELHDTFFLKGTIGKLPKDPKLVNAVKQAHVNGTTGSKGWGGEWNQEDAEKVLLRTHTTCLSAQTLNDLKEKDLPAKFFSIGWNFRNETVDWNHGFELLQTEGIVVDLNANFRNLLGYLKQFAEKMGFEKIRFRPAYFPYTEPSVEGDVWNEEKKEWVEYLAAGIFRPEVTEPLLGKPIPVLAWGPGFGRMLMALFSIKDIRELNENNLTKLRDMKTLKR